MLKAYASAELCIFQNKYDLANYKLDSLKQVSNAQFLEDEILWLKALINVKKKEFSLAATNLERLISVYDNKALEDDAIFKLAMIYENHLNEKNKALELYQKILTDYPESLFSAEARKRFRTLRGDQLN